MKPICVFDFETDMLDTDKLNPVEVACVIIDPYNLEVIPGSEFSSKIRPENIDSDDYLKDRQSTIDWHCKTQGVTQEELLDSWRNSPPLDSTWALFHKHVEKYNKSKSQTDAPIAAGMNIRNFDLKIAERLNKKYKISRMFNHEVIDLRDILFYTLVWDNDLKSRTMDSVRKYMGLESTGAHTALVDVQQEAQLVSRYLKYFKNGFSKNKFKNSFKKEVVNA